MSIVSISQNTGAKPTTSEPECFEYLIFERAGTVAIQTNKSRYFYADSIYFAARDLTKVLRGQFDHLEYGISENRILDPESPEAARYLCVRLDLIQEAIEADEVTSNWSKAVVTLFQYMRDLNSD